ncbi:MAG TPA: hypothetical protein VNN10_12775 [Dehalococcoidia bacterium]|nr:hypothetical protein [Dehalococcoidia bacterium]
MRMGRNRPGASTDFIDTSTRETLLRIACSSGGEALIAFKLYDSSGELVAQTDGFMACGEGITVVANDGEVLLEVSPYLQDHIRYRLYNREGRLLTFSDGMRTQLFAFLHMEKARI